MEEDLNEMISQWENILYNAETDKDRLVVSARISRQLESYLNYLRFIGNLSNYCITESGYIKYLHDNYSLEWEVVISYNHGIEPEYFILSLSPTKPLHINKVLKKHKMSQ